MERPKVYDLRFVPRLKRVEKKESGKVAQFSYKLNQTNRQLLSQVIGRAKYFEGLLHAKLAVAVGAGEVDGVFQGLLLC